MAELVKITQLSPTMKEGILVEWNKREGDEVKVGETIAQIETDKAVMDLESFDEGILLKILAQPKEQLPVGATIAIIGESGEDLTDLLNQINQKDSRSNEKNNTALQSAVKTEDQNPVSAVINKPNNTGRIKASPLARKISKIEGVDIKTLSGSGPGGRIVKKDVLKNLTELNSKKDFSKSDIEIPLSMMRQTIARRLTESKSNIPHFYLTKTVNMTRCIELRKAINTDLEMIKDRSLPSKISLNDFILKATALALSKHDGMRSYWNETHLIQKNQVNLGFAVAITDGLLTPVIQNADRLSLFSISQEARLLAEKARSRKLSEAELSGGVCTISNLGMYGIDFFSGIINPPEASLLSVGNIKVEPHWNGSEFVPISVLLLTLSCDHRVVDGALGAEFLRTLTVLLENPGLLYQ